MTAPRNFNTLMEQLKQNMLAQKKDTRKTFPKDRKYIEDVFGLGKSCFNMIAPTTRTESIEQFQLKGVVRNIDFRSRTKIEIHSNKPNTSFNLENLEKIAKGIVGRQILLLSKGSIIVLKDINFSLHKKYLQRLKLHNHQNKENTTEVQSSVLYRVRPKEIYTIKKPLSSIIQAENILCESSCQIYYDVANNSFTDIKSPLLCKSKHNDGNTVRGNASIFASHRSRHCSVLPPRPVSLDSNGFKQLERRQWQHWKCVVIAPWTATGPRSGETSKHSPVTQPSEDTVDGSPVYREYDRDLSVDQYSFYQPMVRPFNTRQRDALIVSTVDLEFFARILFSRIVLKDIFATLKIAALA